MFPPAQYDDYVSRLLKKRVCRKEERLRSFDTKTNCTADVSSLPSINNPEAQEISFLYLKPGSTFHNNKK
jgi:hypothetical protein